MFPKTAAFTIMFILIIGALALPFSETADGGPGTPSSDIIGGQDAPGGEGTRQAGTANWTFIAYMSGDSSLSDNVDYDIEEMERVGSGDGLDIVALTDKNGNGDSRALHVLEGSSEVFMPSEIDASWDDELNLGSPDVLTTFVLWAAAMYPADYYVLDLWGHGTGWTGVSPDKGDEIESGELKEALEALNAAGFRPDIVSMDACQMGMLEVFYQMKGLADYSIASEKDVPSAGWPYHSILQILRDDPAILPEEFGRQFVDTYIVWGMANSAYSLTLSFVELDELADVATALDALSDELMVDADYFQPEISAARDLTEKYDGANQYDLKHLAQNIAAATGAGSIEGLNEDLAEAINAAVVYERHWTRVNDEPADNATGISIWFPLYSPRYTGYTNLAISIDTAWDEFLTVFEEDARRGGRLSSALSHNVTSFDTGGDGLNDTIKIEASGDPSLTINVEIYKDSGEMVHTVSSQGSITHEWAPESPGYYSTHIYLRNETGHLLNFTRVDDLTSEVSYTVSGKVISNTGKGLAWVRMTVADNSTGYVGDFTTSADGSFEIELVGPHDTDGLNLTVTAHQGQYTQSITIDSLDSGTHLRFEIPEGPPLTVPLMYLATAFDIIALALLAIYIAGRRKVTADEKKEDANV